MTTTPNKKTMRTIQMKDKEETLVVLGAVQAVFTEGKALSISLMASDSLTLHYKDEKETKDDKTRIAEALN